MAALGPSIILLFLQTQVVTMLYTAYGMDTVLSEQVANFLTAVINALWHQMPVSPTPNNRLCAVQQWSFNHIIC